MLEKRNCTSVKAVVELEKPHIHLTQQKLYTLFSIGFNYFLFESGRNPGHYIIRVEDSYLLEKLIRKSKDDTSRNFSKDWPHASLSISNLCFISIF